MTARFIGLTARFFILPARLFRLPAQSLVQPVANAEVIKTTARFVLADCRGFITLTARLYLLP
jgi:hypothetical protein